MGEDIDDKTFLIDLIPKLNGGYDNVIEKIHDMIDEAEEEGKEIDIERIRDRLRSRYERLRKSGGPRHRKYQGRKKNDQEDDEEDSDGDDADGEDKALVSAGFKGRCHRCGMFGHKGWECPNNNNKNQHGYQGNCLGQYGRKPVTCYRCGKKGHIAPLCPDQKTIRR